jgi:predicted DCC family thiol-disulfide oxidoreductase YuxK
VGTKGRQEQRLLSEAQAVVRVWHSLRSLGSFAFLWC